MFISISFSRAVSVKENGDGAVVQGLDLHFSAELAVLHGEAPLPAMGHKVLVQRNGQVRFGGPGEAGAAGGGVGKEGELGDHQKAAAHLLQIQIHFIVFVFENTEIADFVRQLDGGVVGVVGGDPQQDQIALADLAVDVSVDGDGGVLHAGDDCAHRCSFLAPLPGHGGGLPGFAGRE